MQWASQRSASGSIDLVGEPAERAAKDGPQLGGPGEKSTATTKKRSRFAWLRMSSVLSVVGGLIVWQCLAVFGVVDDLFLPPVTDILRTLTTDLFSGELNDDLIATALPFAVGLLISVVLGSLIGVLMGLSSVVEGVLSPWVLALNSVPRIAFVPMLVVAFGLGFEMHIVVVISTSIIPVIITMHAGVKSVDRDLLEMGRSFRVSRLISLRHIQLPYTTPFFISGFQVALGHALVGEIVAEFFAANAGIGFQLNMATQLYDMTTAYSMIIILAVAGVLLAQIMRLFENRVKEWRGE